MPPRSGPRWATCSTRARSAPSCSAAISCCARKSASPSGDGSTQHERAGGCLAAQVGGNHGDAYLGELDAAWKRAMEDELPDVELHPARQRLAIFPAGLVDQHVARIGMPERGGRYGMQERHAGAAIQVRDAL